VLGLSPAETDDRFLKQHIHNSKKERKNR